MIIIDSQRAMESLRKAVEGKEDFVYKPAGFPGICMYLTSDDEPSCLVGHVLVDLGVPKKVIREVGNASPVSSITHSLERYGIRITNRAARLLQEGQGRQDRRETWLQALWAAESLMYGERPSPPLDKVASTL